MKLYQLIPAEIEKVETLHKSRKNVLLIICDHGEGYIGIDADALESPEFEEYSILLSDTFDDKRVFVGEVVPSKTTVTPVVAV